MLKESEIIIPAKKGDIRAMTRLLQDNRGIVAAVVSRFIWEKEQQKDVIQTIFSRIIQNISSFKNNGLVTHWQQES
jgi:hypothetical protein